MRGDHTCTVPVVSRAAPRALGKGLCVLFASQNELLVPRRVDSGLPPLRWKELSARRGEEAAPTAELRAESGRGSPGLGAGSGPGVSNTAVTGRGPSRLRDGGEGGPALRAHLQFLTLLAGPPPLAGERAENFCWDKRSLCIFFFFFP